jgi:hypothetical protein
MYPLAYPLCYDHLNPDNLYQSWDLLFRSRALANPEFPGCSYPKNPWTSLSLFRSRGSNFMLPDQLPNGQRGVSTSIVMFRDFDERAKSQSFDRLSQQFSLAMYRLGVRPGLIQQDQITVCYAMYGGSVSKLHRFPWTYKSNG